MGFLFLQILYFLMTNHALLISCLTILILIKGIVLKRAHMSFLINQFLHLIHLCLEDYVVRIWDII